MSEIAKEMLQAFQSAQNIVITAHKSPDGDSVGSSLALFHLLKKWQKHVIVIHPDATPNYLQWTPGSAEILVFEEKQEEATKLMEAADLICCLDYNEPSRVGKDMEVVLSNSSAKKMMIDHHLFPADFCDWMYSDPEVCSTTAMIYRWMNEAGVVKDLDTQIGTCLYLGVMTDSGSFRFPSVTAELHRMIADLIEIGVKHSAIHEQVYDTNTLDRIRLKGFALSEKLVCLEGLPVAYISLMESELKQFNYQKGDTEGLVNQVLGIQGIKMAVLFTESEGKVKMSLRSKGDYEVNELARTHFEGGGHKYASGGISFVSMEETTKKFVTFVKDFIPTT